MYVSTTWYLQLVLQECSFLCKYPLIKPHSKIRSCTKQTLSIRLHRKIKALCMVLPGAFLCAHKCAATTDSKYLCSCFVFHQWYAADIILDQKSDHWKRGAGGSKKKISIHYKLLHESYYNSVSYFTVRLNHYLLTVSPETLLTHQIILRNLLIAAVI